MRQPTRTFTLEFKQAAVQLLATSGKSGTMLAKELWISDSVLYGWRKELRTQRAVAFPGKGQQTELEEEVRRLRRENANVMLTRFGGSSASLVLSCGQTHGVVLSNAHHAA